MLAPALLLVALTAPPDALPPAARAALDGPALSDSPVEFDGEVDGAFHAGFPIAFTLAAPGAWQETGDQNPFTAYHLTAEFAFETDEPYRDPGVRVPGYFAADGNAGHTGADAGNKWRVHYRPTRPGRLNYQLELKLGDRVVAAGRGTLDVEAPPDAPAEARDFRRRGALSAWDGRLVLVPPGGSPAGGTPFYKTGADSPENLLAYADFDGTYSLKSKPRQGESHSEAPHRYEPHVQDWKNGDPTWGDGKGKGLIGALNYLASAGVNSIYFLPHNVAGDGRDVWPYADPDDRTRFDCSKLDQWEIVFGHCDKLGIALHVILSETENESLFEHRDGPGDGDVPFADTRKQYYRELIARFAHHPALVWNLGEENGPQEDDKPLSDGRGNTNAQRLAFAAFIKETDPYDHPIVVHTYPGKQDAVYKPLLGSPHFDGVSLQLSPMSKAREETLKWVEQSAAAGRPWFVCLDEVGPANAGVLPDDADGAEENHLAVRRALWANLLSGGSGAEWYFGYKYAHNDLNLEDFRSRANVWRFSKIAREFAEREGLHLYEPGPEVSGAKGAVAATRPAGAGRPATTLLYFPAGATPRLTLPKGPLTIRWFDPETGGEWQRGRSDSIFGDATIGIGDAPDDARDWVAKIGG
ncbi:DUF5060 domain-containing protein [Alienimonas californiensis]|uniref:DUF5060 domain-containing protein n=1 Tax=Alienimonas californiensis TaxID=2527989 RepID=A0A517P749_9PLAN|nr:DUF5060 domain-containing protein [Alienimonas californiensis]QDT15209.1 hypothetical protein CA12_12910 [Alienimonas californiensis]